MKLQISENDVHESELRKRLFEANVSKALRAEGQGREVSIIAIEITSTSLLWSLRMSRHEIERELEEMHVAYQLQSGKTPW